MDDVLARISSCLADEDLAAMHHPAGRCWWVTFDIDGREKPTMLVHPPNDEYVIAATQIDSPVLAHQSLAELAPEVLVALFATGTDETFLASVTYVPTSSEYFATSACSVEGPSGKKLRRRMEACARLAVALENALSPLATAPRRAPVQKAAKPGAKKPRPTKKR